MSYTVLNGNEVAENKNYKTQVWKATHNMGDEKRLPFMYRSFISFTYGGKYIEDFGLIAITENNSIDRNLSAEFNDYVTEPDIIHGQLYWGTKYTANQLNLILCTDEITEKQLVNFSQWFRAGIARELILSEHPNRAIMARLSAPPEYHLLPFEKNFSSPIYGTKTSTTVYKGKINISFIMDDPFWYAKYNIIQYSGGVIKDYINNTDINMSLEDVLKFVEEDGIPLAGSITDNILIGKNIVVTVSQKPARVFKSGDNRIDNPEAFIGAIIGGNSSIGVNTGPDIENLQPGDKQYFYYPGTAPSYPHLIFTMEVICSTYPYYVISPRNKYASDSSTPYNTITISSTTTKEFKFTTPSFLTACNQAINIVANSGKTGEELNELLRDGVNHRLVRSYVIKNGIERLIEAIPNTITFDINCKTGETIVKYNFDGKDIEEDAGDAIKSDYLVIEDRNYPDESGYIKSYISGPERSHYISHDVSGGLKKVYLNYDYMYL